MAAHSAYLASLSAEERENLIKELYNIQGGRCFISGKQIDLILHKNELDIDHVKPLANGGKDEKSNMALTFASANRMKQAADLNLARVIWKFKEYSDVLLKTSNRYPNLTDILLQNGGGNHKLHYTIKDNEISISFPEIGNCDIIKLPIYEDKLCKEKYFFATLPIEYIYHDDKINPRSIGDNVSKLLAEFYKGNPQLHISLGYIETNDKNETEVKLFDGQHKAAAQIMLGVKEIPVRIFIDPNKERLTETNYNAGTTLKQVAFGKSVQRHLGSQFYQDRVKQYQEKTMRNSDDYSFSEKDLINYFKGESSQMKRYIIDSVKDSVTYHEDNKLREYMDMAGKGKEKPLSYSTVEKTFYSFFISNEPLETKIDYRLAEGLNPRELEKEQLVHLMNIIADVILIDKFDPEIGTSRIEDKIKNGEKINWDHVVGYRMMKEEIIYSWLKFVLSVITTYYATMGTLTTGRKNWFQEKLPDQLWLNITNFIKNLSELPMWKSTEFSNTIFGGKQNYAYWDNIFTKGETIDGVKILPEPLNILKMIQN